MTVKAWFSSNNNSNNSIRKNNKKQLQRQLSPTITTITAPLPPFSTPPPPYSHALTPSTSSSPSTLSSSFHINKKSPLRHTSMQSQQPQQHHTYSSASHNEPTSPTSPRPYSLLVLPTTTSTSRSCSPSSIDNDLFISMTMNPHKSVPRPPAEFLIRSTTTTTTTPLTCNTNKNSTATYSNTSSNLDKALPAPPKRALFKGLKTRLRSHSFSSSTFSFPTSPQDHSAIAFVASGNRSSSTVSTTPESVAQEYARTIKSLWKMVEDEEQAYRLVEASHSLSGSIPTITDIVPKGRLANRPPYIDTMTAALRRPSLPLLMTIPPIQEEEEESSITSTTSETRTPFSPCPSSGPRRHHGVSFIALDNIPFHTTKPTTDNNAIALEVSASNEMDDTVADLEVSLGGLSDASEEEDYAEDSEEEEERAVVHVAQKISVYRGRSFCWSQPS